MLKIERHKCMFSRGCFRNGCGQFIYHLPVIRTNDKSLTLVEGILIHFSPHKNLPSMVSEKIYVKSSFHDKNSRGKILIVVYRQVFDLKEITSDAF